MCGQQINCLPDFLSLSLSLVFQHNSIIYILHNNGAQIQLNWGNKLDLSTFDQPAIHLPIFTHVFSFISHYYSQ